MAQCCQSIQLPPTPLPESLVYALQKKKKKGSIIFYRSSPVALNRERLYQYYKSRRCCQSVSGVCRVQVHFCVQLTSHLSKSGVRSSAIFFRWARAERLKWPFVLAAVREERKGARRLFEGCRSRLLSPRLTGVIRNRAMWRDALLE